MNYMTVAFMGLSMLLQNVVTMMIDTPSSFRLSPLQQTVTLGTPVTIEVLEKNDSDHDIIIEYDNFPEERYFVNVTNSEGVRPKMTEHYGTVLRVLFPQRPETPAWKDTPAHKAERARGVYIVEADTGHRSAMLTLKPGEEIRETLLLTKLYSLDAVGTYTVQLKRGAGKTEVVSNPVTVMVTN
jgi:hypothetical protein